MPYSLKYGIFHWIVHFLMATLSAWILISISPTADIPLTYGIVYLATVSIDADHLGDWFKGGLNYVLKQMKIAHYPLHKFKFLVVCILLLGIFAVMKNIILSAIFTGILGHMLWDLFDDAVIFKIGFKNWM